MTAPFVGTGAVALLAADAVPGGYRLRVSVGGVEMLS